MPTIRCHPALLMRFVLVLAAAVPGGPSAAVAGGTASLAPAGHDAVAAQGAGKAETGRLGAAPTSVPAVYAWFEYTGRDAAFEQPVPPGHFRNPILAGFHADPSVVAANGRYYLVNSTFTYFPGIPIFESTDLVHWTQIGSVIDRPATLDFDGLGVSRGIFAPTISFHDGLFRVVTTAVDSGGNFISTARDPAGPWSDPLWLPDVGGIDPSLFFDDDGTVYLLNNDAPAGTPRYEGHRAIWIRALDLATGRQIGAPTVVVDGGVDPASNPIWIEGPHLYKVDGWYYLSAAEGGTGPQHSQVVLRSRAPRGPYVPSPQTPILTQRDLPLDRPLPITNVGHADLVQVPDGGWWAVFLASRNHAGVHYNSGRETYLLPVSWRDGWPMILPQGKTIPYVLPGPPGMDAGGDQTPLTGNFTWRDTFDDAAHAKAWLQVRMPRVAWHDRAEQRGTLTIRPLPAGLDTLGNPSFLARRVQHIHFDAHTALQVPGEGTSAGIAAFQNERFWSFLGVRRDGDGLELFVEQRTGDAPAAVVARRRIALPEDGITLTLSVDGASGAYGYDGGAGQEWLLRDADTTHLSTERAGGFVGAMVGPYARDERRGDERGDDDRGDDVRGAEGRSP